MRKIFEKDHNDILERYFNYERTTQIAKVYNVAVSTISVTIKELLYKKGLQPRKRVSSTPYPGNFIGKKFGELEVVELIAPTVQQGKWEAKCYCRVCGNEEFFIPPRELRCRKNPTCGCKTWERKKGKNSPRFKGLEEITGSMWHQIKRGASTRGFEFKITIEYIWNLFLEQNKKCALSGMEISFGKSNYDGTSASLDRIDSVKGYIEGNVQWLHKDINKMKLHHSQEHFIILCNNVVKNCERAINKK